MLATHLCNLTNLRPRNHTIKGYSKRLEASPIAVSNPLECLPIICSSSIEWIGLRENVNRKAPYFMGKSLVSGSVPNKTNPFSIRNNGDLRCLYTENIYHTLYTYTTDFYILMIYHTLYTIDYTPYIISSIIHYIPYNISIFLYPYTYDIIIDQSIDPSNSPVFCRLLGTAKKCLLWPWRRTISRCLTGRLAALARDFI